jgi:hypothetical protein
MMKSRAWPQHSNKIKLVMPARVMPDLTEASDRRFGATLAHYESS